MTPKVLFIIASDPRTSPRPAEAIRIAAGVGTWKKADVCVYLRGPAILALGEYVDELKDEDNFTHYLPILKDFKRPVLVQKASPFLAELGQPSLPYEEIDDGQLATEAAGSNYVLRF
jgi:hypothetical protein